MRVRIYRDDDYSDYLLLIDNTSDNDPFCIDIDYALFNEYLTIKEKYIRLQGKLEQLYYNAYIKKMKNEREKENKKSNNTEQQQYCYLNPKLPIKHICVCIYCRRKCPYSSRKHSQRKQ